VQEPTLVSGNTLEGRYWSDGKADLPMLPAFPEITVCQACATFFWVADAETVGQLGAEGDDDGAEGDLSPGMPFLLARPDWELADRVQSLSAEGYQAAIDRGLGSDPQRLFSLRLWLWWAINDEIREDESIPGLSPEGAAMLSANAAELKKLLNRRRASDRLFLAELAREEGRHAECIALLKHMTPDYQFAAGVIGRLAEAGDSRVRELPTGEEPTSA
jgi:hypothetical protein